MPHPLTQDKPFFLSLDSHNLGLDCSLFYRLVYFFTSVSIVTNFVYKNHYSPPFISPLEVSLFPDVAFVEGIWWPFNHFLSGSITSKHFLLYLWISPSDSGLIVFHVQIPPLFCSVLRSRASSKVALITLRKKRGLWDEKQLIKKKNLS